MRIDHIMVLNNKIKVTYEWNTVRSTAAFCNTYITNQITQIGFRLDSYAAYSDTHNITDKLFVAVRWDKRAGVVFDKIFYQNDVFDDVRYWIEKFVFTRKSINMMFKRILSNDQYGILSNNFLSKADIRNIALEPYEIDDDTL